MVRVNKESATGRPTWALGGRVGYWPCVQGPFLQLTAGRKHLSVWWGYAEA